MEGGLAQSVRRVRQPFLKPMIPKPFRAALLAPATALLLYSVSWSETVEKAVFRRIATYPVYQNAPDLKRTAAEIIALDGTGRLLLYADSLGGGIGFLDISTPHRPQGLGWTRLQGEPTSVAIAGNQALLVVNDGNFQGRLLIFDLSRRSVEAELPLPGQPDAIAVSPDGQFAAIVLENEAEEDFPHPPPGDLVIVDLLSSDRSRSLRRVSLTGLAESHPEDPEPEYVAINESNLAAVTLQENNHLVLVDLPSGKIVNHFSAGVVHVRGQTEPVPREPDGVEWCSLGIVTADEGDLRGGGRSFTIFSTTGEVVYTSGDQLERIARVHGQYPRDRHLKRGVEPESVKVAHVGERELLFLGGERSNLVYIFEITKQGPRFLQAVSAGVGPESLEVDPKRGLLLVGSEVDDQKKKIRSNLSIFELSEEKGSPHNLISDGGDWGSLSGLTVDPEQPRFLYTVGDHSLAPNRLLKIDTAVNPYRIIQSIFLTGADGKATHYDLEGLVKLPGSNFWLIAEARKKSGNLLLEVSSEGEIKREVSLPTETESVGMKHGVEGIAWISPHLYVAYQAGEGRFGGAVPILRYDPRSEVWEKALFPLADDHFVSGLTGGPGGTLAVLVRDKNGREQAVTKAIFSVDPGDFSTGRLKKQASVDLMTEYDRQGIPVPEKPEGVTYDGSFFWVINDNDGLKDSYGETMLVKIRSN